MKSLCLVVALLALQALANTSVAIYTTTQGTPNMLNVYSVNASGYMNYVKEVGTGGNGGALGSQGSVVVYNNYIFAVNPASNSVSLFSISATDATDVTLLGVANTTYDWPNSVTVSGNTACVVTSGATNGVECFTFSSTALTPIPTGICNLHLNLTTPPAFHTGPSQISFTLDGSALIVAIKNTSPRLAGPSVYLFTTPLTASTCASAATAGPLGNVPFGFALDNSYMVLTDAAPYGTSGGVIPLTHTSNSIAYAANFTVLDGDLATCWATWNSNSGKFYVANSGSASITELSRSGSTVSKVATYTAGTGNSTIEGGFNDMVTVTLDGGDYLYVSAGLHVHAFQLGSSPALLQSLATPNMKNSGMASIVIRTSSDSSTTASTTMGSTSGASSMLATIVVVLVAILVAF